VSNKGARLIQVKAREWNGRRGSSFRFSQDPKEPDYKVIDRTSASGIRFRGKKGFKTIPPSQEIWVFALGDETG